MTTTVGLALAVGSVLFERNERRYMEALRHLDRRDFAALGAAALFLAAFAVGWSFRYLSSSQDLPASGLVTPQRLLIASFGLAAIILMALIFIALRLTQATLLPSLLRRRARKRPNSSREIINSLYNLATDSIERMDLDAFRAAALTMVEIADDVTDMGANVDQACGVEQKAFGSLKGLYTKSADRWDYGTSCLRILRFFVDSPSDTAVRCRRSTLVAGDAQDLMASALDQEHPSRRHIEQLFELLDGVLRHCSSDGTCGASSAHLGTVDKAVERLAATRVASSIPVDIAEQIDMRLPQLLIQSRDTKLLNAYCSWVSQARLHEITSTSGSNLLVALAPTTSTILVELAAQAAESSATRGSAAAQRNAWTTVSLTPLLTATYQSSPDRIGRADLDAIGSILACRGKAGLNALRDFIQADPARTSWSGALLVRTALSGGQLDPTILQITDQQHLDSWANAVGSEMARWTAAVEVTAETEAPHIIVGRMRRSLVEALSKCDETRGTASVVPFAILEALSRSEARQQAATAGLSLFFGNPEAEDAIQRQRFLSPGLSDCSAVAYQLLEKAIARLRTAFMQNDSSKDAVARPSVDVIVAAVVMIAELSVIDSAREALKLSRGALDMLDRDTVIWDGIRLNPLLASQLVSSLQLIADVIVEDPLNNDLRLSDLWVITSILSQANDVIATSEVASTSAQGDPFDDDDSDFDVDIDAEDRGLPGDGGLFVESSDAPEHEVEYLEGDDSLTRLIDEAPEPDPVLVALGQLHSAAKAAAHQCGRNAVGATRDQRERSVSQYLGRPGFDRWWADGIGEAFWSSFSEERGRRIIDHEKEGSIHRNAEGLPWSSSLAGEPPVSEQQFLESLVEELTTQDPIDFRDVSSIVAGLIGTEPARAASLIEEIRDRIGRADYSRWLAFWFAVTGMPSPEARRDVIIGNAFDIPPRAVERALEGFTASQLDAVSIGLRERCDSGCQHDDNCAALRAFRSLRWRISNARKQGKPSPKVEPLLALSTIGHVARCHPKETVPSAFMRITIDTAWTLYGRPDTLYWLFELCHESFRGDRNARQRATRRCMDIGPTPQFVVDHILQLSPNALATWLSDANEQARRMFWQELTLKMQGGQTSTPTYASRVLKHTEYILRRQLKTESATRVEIMELYAFSVEFIGAADARALSETKWINMLAEGRKNLDPCSPAPAIRSAAEERLLQIGARIAQRQGRAEEFRRRWRSAEKDPAGKAAVRG
ncbi:MAG: hypothetical protein KDB26_13380 [Microthrixaceae bacterium]|nr:hypothetical protein [Microthrixaceae bacterium]